MVPKLMAFEAMEAESYLLFVIWAVLGLIVFRAILVRDQDNRYGRSVIVWIALLLLMLMATMLWVNRQTQQVTDDSILEIQQYYEQKEPGSAFDTEEDS